MEEHVFDEELADRIESEKNKCCYCGVTVSGRKKFCDACYKIHESKRHSKNYMLHKSMRKNNFDKFCCMAKELLKDIDLTQYGVKKG